MDSAISFLRTALCSSSQIEKAMQAFIHAIPHGFCCDGIFLNYYRHDIRSIQFIALATHKAARLKRDLISIPDYIAEQFEQRQDVEVQLINDLKQDVLTEYVVERGFRNIKSVILMRMSLDGMRLGAIGFFSYQPQAYSAEHVALIEAVRGEFSLLSFITLSQHNLLEPSDKRTSVPSLETVPPLLTDDPFVVSSNNTALSALYASLKTLANSQSPILIFGERGVGKKSVASYIREIANQKGIYGILDVKNHQLIYVSPELGIQESIVLNWDESLDIKYFLPLHGGCLLVYELFSLPENWQVFILELMSRYPDFCRIKIIAIQSQTYEDDEEQTQQYLFSQFHHQILCLMVVIPPLRCRYQDIPLLLTHYLSLRFTSDGINKIPRLSPEATQVLWEYHWPGNISELIHLVESSEFFQQGSELMFTMPRVKKQNNILPLDEAMREHIVKALRQSNGRISGKNGAAEILGVNSNTLYSKMKKLGVFTR